MSASTENILNIALVGAAGSGKTSLLEALLFKSGAITHKGTVEEGTTVSDFDAQEKHSQHSHKPSIVSFDHGDRNINVIDTPGFRDFYGRALAVLPAVESAALVLDASAGVDSYATKLMQKIVEQKLCRMIIVNKIDHENIDLEEILEQIQTVFGSECLPINLPTQGMESVVDVFFDQEEVDTELQSVAGAHEKILDQVVEVDEDLMERYLEDDELDEASIHAAFETALREGHLIPICFTSARTDAGIDECLRVFNELLPNPKEGNPAAFYAGSKDQPTAVDISQDANGEFLGHTFMVKIDPFKGRMAFVRVHQGRLNAGGSVFFGDSRKATKLQHIIKVRGEEQIEVDQVVAGDICALPRAEDASYGTILHEVRGQEIPQLESIEIPASMFSRAVGSSDDRNAQRISEALNRFTAEDPSLFVEHVASANETVMRCMGELHLREFLELIEAQYDFKPETRMPSVPYRETITASADGHHRHKKQTGGAGQFGEVYLKVEPLPRGTGFEFVDNVVGGVIPGQFIPAVEKGILQVIEAGSISGHEMQDIRVTVYDGKHHSVDSKEVAFVQAGKKAFQDAISKAKPVIIEPIVDMNINVPSNCMGDVAGDLSSMGGMVSGSSMLSDGSSEIQGQAPLREAQSYYSRLNALSSGKGTYGMQFSHYSPVQAILQKQLISEFQPEDDD